MFLVTGVLAALWEKTHCGKEQTLDRAISDTVQLLAQKMWAFKGNNMWSIALGKYPTSPCGGGIHHLGSSLMSTR